jgi:hypothetical protein
LLLLLLLLLLLRLLLSPSLLRLSVGTAWSWQGRTQQLCKRLQWLLCGACSAAYAASRRASQR